MCRNPFQSIVVRAVEILYACDEALSIIDAHEQPDSPPVDVQPRRAVGHGATEAPRGMLYHRYGIDDDGLITDAWIVPPTSQNQSSIEQDLRAVVQRHADLPDEALRIVCEQAIRNHDPCISCATHFLELTVMRAMSSRTVLVIGVGNQLRGDDAAGLEVARRLGEMPTTVAVRMCEGEAIGLLELWHGVDAVVLIDTVRSGSPAGTVHRFDAGATALPAALSRSSGHTIGVAEAIELARTLGTLPPEVVVYGVEGAVFDTGADLTEPVEAALDGLAEAVRREAIGLSEGSELPRVTIFGPDPLLSVTIEALGAADDIHVHAAGQGVWVARMAGEMGAWPVLCCLLGGETGTTLTTLLMALPGERRVVTSAGPSGSYVIDRRGGERRLLATALRTPPHRHELDDLVAATCAAAIGSAALVVCNPYPPEGLPHEAYETIVSDVRAAGVPVIADLSSPLLDSILPFGPEIVKLNDWELAGYVSGPVDGALALDAMRRLRDAGAQTVVLTRAGEPILVLSGDEEPFEVVPPKFPHGFREGNGDAMTGAVAAAVARGLPLRQALVLGAAAGSGNFLRHGLGTGRRSAVEELAARVLTRPLQDAGAATPAPPQTAG